MTKKQTPRAKLSHYVALTRLNRPTGIWLLLWPCWWSVALASDGWPDPYLLVLFMLGSACMRSAGCIVNDMADRTFDAQVERTKTRPLASGALNMIEAAALLGFLLVLSLLIVLQLHPDLLFYAAASLLLVAAYPFMKRITWWPQAFLGITFNLGALFGWYAVAGSWDWPALCLYFAGIFWTIGYDTIYAHQDIEDDLRIGVKSTAIRFGAKNRLAIAICYGVSVSGWIAAILLAKSGFIAWLGVLVAAGALILQIRRFIPQDGPRALTLFKFNQWAGLSLANAFILDSGVN